MGDFEIKNYVTLRYVLPKTLQQLVAMTIR